MTATRRARKCKQRGGAAARSAPARRIPETIRTACSGPPATACSAPPGACARQLPSGAASESYLERHPYWILWDHPGAPAGGRLRACFASGGRAVMSAWRGLYSSRMTADRLTSDFYSKIRSRYDSACHISQKKSEARLTASPHTAHRPSPEVTAVANKSNKRDGGTSGRDAGCYI